MAKQEMEKWRNKVHTSKASISAGKKEIEAVTYDRDRVLARASRSKRKEDELVERLRKVQKMLSGFRQLIDMSRDQLVEFLEIGSVEAAGKRSGR